MKMLGEKQGSHVEHASPWSLFSDKEIQRLFSKVSVADVTTSVMNCDRVFPLPVNKVSVPRGSNMLSHTAHSLQLLSLPLSSSNSLLLSPDLPTNPSSIVYVFSPQRRQVPPNTMNVILTSLRNLQIDREKSSPSSLQIRTPTFSSPRASNLRHVFNCLPSTPTQTYWVDTWDTS